MFIQFSLTCFHQDMCMFEIVFGCLLEVCVKMEWYVDVGKEALANELHILTQEKGLIIIIF